jgi:hypothetical protein
LGHESRVVYILLHQLQLIVWIDQKALHLLGLLHVVGHEQEHVLQLQIVGLLLDLESLVDRDQSLLVVLLLISVVEQVGSIVVPMGGHLIAHLSHVLVFVDCLLVLLELLVLTGLEKFYFPFELDKLIIA